jgi:hypothetical protein
MNDKMRKTLMDKATMFELKMDNMMVFISKEENGTYTLSDELGRMWHTDDNKWGKRIYPSRRTRKNRHLVEMTLEEAYGIIVLEKI